MDTRGTDDSRGSTARHNNDHHALRPRFGVREHHGPPPYDVWNETIPALPASMPPPFTISTRTSPTSNPSCPHHLPQQTAMLTESDTHTFSNQEGEQAHSTRCHKPKSSSTACTLPDPYKPLREFDMHDSCHYNSTQRENPIPRTRSSKQYKHLSLLRQQKHYRRQEQQQHSQDREAVLLSCYVSSLPPREQFNEPRAYLDHYSMYTTCDAPLPAEAQHIDTPLTTGTVPHTSALRTTMASTPPRPSPPPEPPDPVELAPCDSGCNLPITNPHTVAHFNLDSHPWPVPRWIKFGNGKRECSTHYANFGPIIAKVAILASAPG